MINYSVYLNRHIFVIGKLWPVIVALLDIFYTIIHQSVKKFNYITTGTQRIDNVASTSIEQYDVCCIDVHATLYTGKICSVKKKIREQSRECHNHKSQPLPDTKRKRKPTKPNKHKSNKHPKSTKISSLFPKQGNRNAKSTETQEQNNTR